MGIFKTIIIILLCCLLPMQSICGDNPIKLKQGEVAPYNGYLFSENQFDDLLRLQSDYSIDKKAWAMKEEAYQDFIKKAEKKMSVPWWKSQRMGVALGILFVLAVGCIIAK